MSVAEPMRAPLALVPDASHIVQFWEDEGFVIDTVTQFLADGLAADEPLVVIAIESRRHAFVRRLEQMGVDVAGARARGQLVMLDAHDCLAVFMEGGLPDWDRCYQLIGKQLRTSAQVGRGGRVRAYGEMVDVLTRAGNPDAAIMLEQFWNQIGKLHPLMLLCGYDMASFKDARHRDTFERVCQSHTHVVPTERYVALPRDDQLREVSKLQQRAQALETEIARRKQIEASLVEALRVRDDFLSSASHELRTPLMALTLQVDSLVKLTRDADDARVRERLIGAARQTQRLGKLIDDLLDVSRIHAGKLSITREVMELGAVVREAAERARDARGAEAPPVAIETQDDVGGLWDRGRIDQVVTNLVTNALRYGNGSEVTVVVRATAHEAEIVVRDQGIGIAPEDRERIFERFERAVSPANYGGLGLGLWITRQIVTAHGGEIRCDSVLGQGSTFTVTLPRR